MVLEIAKKNTMEANGSQYKSAEFTVGAKATSVMVVTGKINYVNVTVKSATQKAYRGLGKRFNTIAEALENYKSRELKMAIAAAGELL